MDITLTLNYGPLDAEFQGEDREELQDELIEFINFIEEEQGTLSTLPKPQGNSDSTSEGKQTSATGWEDSQADASRETEDTNDGNSEFASISNKTGVDTDVLSKLYELPDSDDGVPSLNMYHFEDGTLRLGSARNQRQAQASALLMFAWEDCLDEKRIDYDELDEALVASDIETERRNSMGQAFSDGASDWFESDGSSIYLVGKGKNHARELLQELAEELD